MTGATEAAIRRLLSLKLARDSFMGFVRLMRPDWTLPDFQVDLIETLDKFERRELHQPGGTQITGLLVTMPPRHAKTELCTKLFSAYYMGRDPRRHVMSVNYNSILARDFGRAVRNIVRSRDFRHTFEEFELVSGAAAADAWLTTKDGTYYSIGQGATTSGRPATLLNWDDPLKNRKDATSVISRNDAWSYWTSALATRLQPEVDGSPPLRIVVMTRWHPDDPAGRLMKTDEWLSGQWLHLSYPAIIDDETQTVLWPERFSYETLKAKRDADKGEFSALYQQSPHIEGGEILRRDLWQWYTDELAPKDYQMIVVTADTAVKAEEMSDYTVFHAWGLTDDGNIFLIDSYRDKIDFAMQKSMLVTFSAKFRGRGLRGVYIEDAQTGSALIQELRTGSTLPIIPWKSFKDKVARANLVLPLLQSRRVFIPNDASWVGDFVDECEKFPNDRHDDQVDACTMGLDVLSRIGLPDVIPTEEGESLLAQYNRSRILVMGSEKRPKNKSLNKSHGLPQWKGWGA